MGLFDDFDIDMDDVKAAGGFDFEDGSYEFEISEALLQNGTKNKPDTTFFIIKYNLDEAGTYWEWFTVAEDGDSTTPRAKQSLGFLKSRLVDLGFEAASLNEISPEDLEGVRGTLQLKTTKNAKGEFQNVRNVKLVDSDEEDDEPEESDAEIKARVQAKQAARAKAAPKEAPAKPRAKAAPAKRAAKPAPVADDEDEENPFE